MATPTPQDDYVVDAQKCCISCPTDKTIYARFEKKKERGVLKNKGGGGSRSKRNQLTTAE